MMASDESKDGFGGDPIDLLNGSQVSPLPSSTLVDVSISDSDSRSDAITKPVPSETPSTAKEQRRDDHETGSDSHTPQIAVSVDQFEKRGDGMNAYVAYRVVSKTANVAMFGKPSYEVWRRFSDFLGLHDKLATKHLPNGRIIPPAPDKSIVGMTKTKISKTVEDEGTAEFLERRRAGLERFLHRVLQHPLLHQDPDVREFLTLESDLPKASQTSSLSGAQLVKLLGRVGDSITKISSRMEDTDSWFEDKQNEVEQLDEHLRKLHSSVEALIHFRRELAVSTDAYCKSMSLLAACEENTALSRAFSQLSETQEKIGMVQQQQCDKDFYLMGETIKDYITILSAVQDVLNERQKAWFNWQSAQQTLAKKRDLRTKLELQGRSDKLPSAKKEVEEWERKVQEGDEGFQKISKIIRSEIQRFDALRVKDFKEMIAQYMESLALTQQQIIKYWEAFLPEAKAITT